MMNVKIIMECTAINWFWSHQKWGPWQSVLCTAGIKRDGGCLSLVTYYKGVMIFKRGWRRNMLEAVRELGAKVSRIQAKLASSWEILEEAVSSGEPHVFIESKKEKFWKEAVDIGKFSMRKSQVTKQTEDMLGRARRQEMVQIRDAETSTWWQTIWEI